MSDESNNLVNRLVILGSGPTGGAFFKAKEVTIVGEYTAMEEAIFLTRFCSRVTIIHRREGRRFRREFSESGFDFWIVALLRGALLFTRRSTVPRESSRRYGAVESLLYFAALTAALSPRDSSDRSR
jgi:hypothetical protein